MKSSRSLFGMSVLAFSLALPLPMIIGDSGVAAQAVEEIDTFAVQVETLEDLGLDPEFLDSPDGEVDMLSLKSIIIRSNEYDPTILSKYIPGTAFIPSQSSADDRINYSTGGCINPSSTSGGSITEVFAPIELPGNALLTSATFYLYDNDAAANIIFSVKNAWIHFQLTTPTYSLEKDANIASGITSGAPGWIGQTLAFDPPVGTGTVLGLLRSGTHRFFSIKVSLANVAVENHKLCGVRVTYQVPTSGDNQTFTPITPCRIFNSRPDQGGTGKFTANETRTIQVTADTSGQGGDGVCGIPTTATAVATNISVTQPDAQGNLKVWAPDVAEPRAIMFYDAQMNLWNNEATVPISAGTGVTGKGMKIRTLNAGANVVVNVTGYYSPVSNMGN